MTFINDGNDVADDDAGDDDDGESIIKRIVVVKY